MNKFYEAANVIAVFFILPVLIFLSFHARGQRDVVQYDQPQQVQPQYPGVQPDLTVNQPVQQPVQTQPVQVQPVTGVNPNPGINVGVGINPGVGVGVGVRPPERRPIIRPIFRPYGNQPRDIYDPYNQ